MNLMEFLTENNQLFNKIITLIFPFIEAFVYYKLLISILNLNSSNKRQGIIYVTLTGIIGVLSNFLLRNPYINIINISVLILSIYFIFKQNIKNVFVGVIFIYTSVFAASFFIQLLSNIIFDISYSDISNFSLYRFLSILLTYLILYLIALILKQVNCKSKM